VNWLIQIDVNKQGRLEVDGRTLHMQLGIGTEYMKWVERYFTPYGFTEGTDYIVKTDDVLSDKRERTYTATTHKLTISMAKELAMLQRTEQGSAIRKYLIKVEEDWNSPEKVMARALKIAKDELATLRIANEEMKPKAIFADAVSASKTSILIGDLAKLIRQNGVDVGQKRLFGWLRDNGWLIKGGSSKNVPTQKGMEMGLFEIKEGSYVNGEGVNVTTKTTKVTGKGQVYFVNKFLNKANQN
jgi:anti-repressor protein